MLVPMRAPGLIQLLLTLFLAMFTPSAGSKAPRALCQQLDPVTDAAASPERPAPFWIAGPETQAVPTALASPSPPAGPEAPLCGGAGPRPACKPAIHVYSGLSPPTFS